MAVTMFHVLPLAVMVTAASVMLAFPSTKDSFSRIPQGTVRLPTLPAENAESLQRLASSLLVDQPYQVAVRARPHPPLAGLVDLAIPLRGKTQTFCSVYDEVRSALQQPPGSGNLQVHASTIKVVSNNCERTSPRVHA